jgi:FixJ family two-component response regulator
MQELRNRYASLTPCEREVMSLVVSGLLNKQVGGELGISEITMKAHRGQGDAEDESQLDCRFGENGREAP